LELRPCILENEKFGNFRLTQGLTWNSKNVPPILLPFFTAK
jgi:hypothetical protein